MLHWDLSKIDSGIEFYRLLSVSDTDEREYGLMPVTEILIWSTISVGIGDITHENVNEWAWRYFMVAEINRYANVGNTISVVSGQDIRNHIGLHVNVSYEPLDEWIHKLARFDLTRISNHRMKDEGFEEYRPNFIAPLTKYNKQYIISAANVLQKSGSFSIDDRVFYGEELMRIAEDHGWIEEEEELDY